MTYEIESGIPVPKVHSNLKYPWTTLNPGESVFIETDKRTNRILNSATQWAKRRGLDALYVTRTVIQDGKRGIRVWRVK